MNAKKSLILMATAVVITMGAPAYAQAQDNKAGTEPAVEQSAPHIQVHGVIEKTDNGFTLSDGKTVYQLKSEEELDPYAGKVVTVTGYGYTSDSGMVVLINKIDEFE